MWEISKTFCVREGDKISLQNAGDLTGLQHRQTFLELSTSINIQKWEPNVIMEDKVKGLLLERVLKMILIIYFYQK